MPHEIRFEVSEGAQIEVVVTLERWVDAPALGWWAGDNHVHTRLINAHDAATLMVYAKATDTHLLSVLEMGDVTRTQFRNPNHLFVSNYDELARDMEDARGIYTQLPSLAEAETRLRGDPAD